MKNEVKKNNGFGSCENKDAMMRAWPLVGEAVEDQRREPFEKVNEESAIEYYRKRPEQVKLIHKSLKEIGIPFMREMLEAYDGFQGVETLVDVGGNSGISLRMIMEKHPNVRKGINYDLPEMVACAPHIPGVTHVGGNAFQSVPPGDAIFIKWAILGGQIRKQSKCLRTVIPSTLILISLCLSFTNQEQLLNSHLDQLLNKFGTTLLRNDTLQIVSSA